MAAGHINLIIRLYYYYSYCAHAALGQLVVLSECICPGRELRLECTVVGGFTTIWRGTAIDCPSRGNEIVLPHARFESGEVTMCSNGNFGHSLNRTFDGSNSKFTSQLTIHLPLLNDTLDGRTVECTRDGVDVIGNHTIAYGRASDGIHILYNLMYFMKISCYTV